MTRNVAKMWDDYAESIGTTANNLTQAQKIQAEVNGILNETRFQVGDAAKLTGGYAGMVAALGTSFYNLKVAVGNILIPILSLIIPVVKRIVDGLVVLVNQFAQVLSAVFGFKLGMTGAADGTQKAAEQAKALTDNTKKAEKAAKGALAAFDDINVLQTGEGEGAASTATPAGVLPALNTEAMSEELGGMTGKIEGFMRRVQDLLQPTIDALGRLYKAVLPLGRTLWSGLEWAFYNILVPLGEWAVTTLLPAVIDLFTGAVNVLNAAIEALKPVAKWLWEEFLKPAGEWIGEAIINALGWLTDRLNELANWITNNQQAFRDIVIVLGLLAAGWILVSAALAIFTAIATAAAIVIAILTSPITLVVIAIGLLVYAIIQLYRHWDEVGVMAGRVWDWIKEKWRSVANWFNDTVLKPLGQWFKTAWDDIKAMPSDAWNWIKEAWKNAKTWFDEEVLQPLSNFFSAAWTDIKAMPSDAWKWIKDTWEDAKTWFDDNVITPISDAFTDAWDWIETTASNLWTTITGIFSDVGGWFRDNVTTPLSDAFDSAIDTIDTAWRNILSGITSFARSQINAVIGMLNGFISAIASVFNAVINAVNSIRVTIPSWVPYYGGNSFGVWLPPVYAGHIPYLAQGAVIPPNSEFMAVLGDQRSGTNIETPERLLRQIMSEEMGKIEADIQISFAGSLGALVRELKPHIDRETVRVGGSLIKGATA